MVLWQARAAREAAEEGRHADARTDLARLARSTFRDVPRGGVYLATLAELGLAVCALDAKEHASTLFDLLQPYVQQHAMDEFFFSLRSVAYYLGSLALLLDDRSTPLEQLEAALFKAGHAIDDASPVMSPRV